MSIQLTIESDSTTACFIVYVRFLYNVLAWIQQKIVPCRKELLCLTWKI